MTSHTRIIDHGRRERGGWRREQHGAPLDVFKISVSECVSETELELGTSPCCGGGTGYREGLMFEA